MNICNLKITDVLNVNNKKYSATKVEVVLDKRAKSFYKQTDRAIDIKYSLQNLETIERNLIR